MFLLFLLSRRYKASLSGEGIRRLCNDSIVVISEIALMHYLILKISKKRNMSKSVGGIHV